MFFVRKIYIRIDTGYVHIIRRYETDECTESGNDHGKIRKKIQFVYKMRSEFVFIFWTEREKG